MGRKKKRGAFLSKKSHVFMGKEKKKKKVPRGKVNVRFRRDPREKRGRGESSFLPKGDCDVLLEGH